MRRGTTDETKKTDQRDEAIRVSTATETVMMEATLNRTDLVIVSERALTDLRDQNAVNDRTVLVTALAKIVEIDSEKTVVEIVSERTVVAAGLVRAVANEVDAVAATVHTVVTVRIVEIAETALTVLTVVMAEIVLTVVIAQNDLNVLSDSKPTRMVKVMRLVKEAVAEEEAWDAVEAVVVEDLKDVAAGGTLTASQDLIEPVSNL